MLSVDQAVGQLCDGPGYLLLEGYVPSDKVAEARRRIYELAETEPDRTSHFHGDEPEPTQKRVWNLPEKGEIFRELCSDEFITSIIRQILGKDMMLSSYAANVLYPGAPAQEAHVDYPYWDLHDRDRWPRGLNASFFLAVETVLALDDFTEENGATAFVPDSHRLARWPAADEFERSARRALGPAGTVLIFPALLWHAAQANRSSAPRASLLASYTQKSIKPIEDWRRTISDETLAACSPAMRALLGADYAYPAVMDALPGRSSEGMRSKKSITE